MPELTEAEISYIFSFLLTREAILFAVDVSAHIFASALRVYCSKITKICLFPLKQLAVAPPHSYEVRVLLNELYPDQGHVFGAATTLHGNDLIHLEDYLISPNKLGFEDVNDSQLDEINFLFQTNHLPMCVFRPSSADREQGVCSTSTTGSTDPVAPVRPFDVPSPLPTAGSESVSVRLSDNLWPVEVKPKLATSHSLTSTEIKPRAPKSGTSSSSGYGSLTNEICTESDPELLVSPTKAVSSYFTQASSQPSLKPFSRTVGYSGASSTASDVHTSVQSEDSADAFCDVLQSPVRNRRKRYSAISSSSSCSEDFPFYGESSSSYANQIRSGRIPIFTGPLSAKLFPPSQPPLASTTPCQPVLKSLSNEMLSHGLPPKTHTRGASSPPPNFERLRGRQRTLTDVSRLAESEDSDTSDAHASDSECYRFPDLPTPPILPPLSGQRQQGQERVSYSYGSSVSKSLNSTLNAGATFQGLKHDPFLDDFSDCSVAPYHSSLSNEQLSETDHSERHIRDVHILERLRVPFTYDEVAYSTNETFREMKATPGLSLDQITAMLDARRRATNRQAAERCRRGKSAARDSLANQLGRLRLERAHLTKRLVRTRKRRQCLRDKLSIAQQTFVQGLMGPDGKYLDPAMWRVQTTSQGELVVVRVVDLP